MKRFLFPLLVCLTLGLAPFVPEPHIVGKVRWVLGGANGMQPMDWFDLLLHGSPWVWLVTELARAAVERATPRRPETPST